MRVAAAGVQRPWAYFDFAEQPDAVRIRDPVVALGVAAGLGFLASGILKPRATPTERMKDALADCFEDFTGRFRSQLDDVTTRRPGVSQTVKAAATGLLVKAATDFVRNRISNSYDQQREDPWLLEKSICRASTHQHDDPGYGVFNRSSK